MGDIRDLWDDGDPQAPAGFKAWGEEISDAVDVPPPLDVAEVTSGTAASLTLTIPAGVGAVRVVGRARTDADTLRTALRARVNNVSTGIYQEQRITWTMNSTTPAVTFNTSETAWSLGAVVVGSQGSASRFSVAEFTIPRTDAAEPVKEMQFQAYADPSGASAEARTVHGGGRVGISPAITSLVLLLGAGNFVEGTRFELRPA